MISITNIQKNITRAEVWGNIPVLRCGSGSGKPKFFVGGVCDSEISARIFGVFVGGSGSAGAGIVYCAGAGAGVLLRFAASLLRFVCTFHVLPCIQYANKRTQTYDFFCAIFLLTINELCKDEKIF